jgi:hypothetical protein
VQALLPEREREQGLEWEPAQAPLVELGPERALPERSAPPAEMSLLRLFLQIFGSLSIMPGLR